MQQDNVRQKVFTRRAALLAGAQLGLFGLLGARLYYLQVVENERFKTLADDNRIALRLLAPQRGRIVDRFGTPLAYNELNYRVVIVPEQTGSVAVTLDVLSTIFPITDADRRRILREVSRKRRFVPVMVRDGLTWDEVSKVAVNAADLPGVSVEAGLNRHYPLATDMAHIVGYVAPPAEADLTGDPLLELPDFRVGRNGVERVYDLALRGRAGSSQIEVNALGRPIRELTRTEGEAGVDLVLTVDAELQRFSSQRLTEEQSAAAALIDVRSGEVLALASHPGYDPNEFARGISPTSWRALTSNNRAPLTNKPVAGQYAPGSTFKMIVAMAALEGGVVGPDFRVGCPGHYDLGDNRFHCWKKGGHGSVDMLEGIKQSCDVYFYEVARRVGVDAIAAMARRFGFGRALAVDLPGERAGLIPTRDWKAAVTGVPWQQGETLVAGIGQGYVLSTPLQLAVYVARIVNGGQAIVPQVTREQIIDRRAVPRANTPPPPVGVSAKTLQFMVRAMTGVVNDPRGTAFRARSTEPGTMFGGKTGTSQVRRITEEERRVGLRKPEQVPWHERDNALFVGFAPVEAPRYAVAVVVEHGGGGSAVAAPIARDILVEAIKRERDRPRPYQRLAGDPAAKPL